MVFFVSRNEVKNVKDSRIEYFADWKYNLLYHFCFSWFSAVTALNQETDSRGNPAKKHCLIDKEIVQECGIIIKYKVVCLLLERSRDVKTADST